MSSEWKDLLAARESEEHFVVEGRHAVERLQASSYQIEKIIRIGQELSREEASRLLGFRFHRSHLAIACKPENPPLKHLQDCGGTLVVLPEIADPGNLGTIIRNTAALGGTAVLLGKGASPWNAKAVRASAGALFRLPVRLSENLREDLAEIRLSHHLIGTSLSPRSLPLSRLPPPSRPPALLLGAEDFGLAAETEQVCHHLVQIPMARNLDSLNVASASAIFLHHLREIAIRRDPES